MQETLPRLVGGRGDRSNDGDPGVVEHGVDRTRLPLGQVKGRRDGHRVADVTGVGQGACAVGPARLGLVAREGEEQHRSSRAGKRERTGEPDPGAAAGDQRDSTVDAIYRAARPLPNASTAR